MAAVELRFDFDIGNVLADGSNDTMFTDDFLDTPELPLAFDVLAELNALYPGKVGLISKCGLKMQEKTRQWLVYRRFAERTGILLDDEHLNFCLKRPEKALIAELLGTTHFVDDRLDVLEPMVSVPYRFLLCSPEKARRHRQYNELQGIAVVHDWQEVHDRIYQTLS